MKLIIMKIVAMTCLMLLVSCASKVQQTQNESTKMTIGHDGNASEQMDEMMLDIDEQHNPLHEHENQLHAQPQEVEQSKHLTFINFIVELEQSINDDVKLNNYINKINVAEYITYKNVLVDKSSINASEIARLLLTKIDNNTKDATVFYFDTVVSIDSDYIESRFLVYRNDGNMNAMSIYLNKYDLSIVDVSLDNDQSTLVEKVANLLFMYDKPVNNSSTESAVNYLAPIMQNYYPQEQLELMDILMKIQSANQIEQVVNVYSELNDKYKTLHLLEFIEIKSLSENWNNDLLIEKLVVNTDPSSDAYVFFAFYFLNADNYDLFFKLSALQDPYYQQSISWHFYQLIASNLAGNKVKVNEAMYQLFTRFGAYDFVYYVLVLQYIRMNELEMAQLAEDAMLKRFDYEVSNEDLLSTPNGEKYIQRYK